MSTYDAERSANIAASQANEAANIIKRKVATTDEERYQEYLALSVANLAIAVKQMADAMKR